MGPFTKPPELQQSHHTTAACSPHVTCLLQAQPVWGNYVETGPHVGQVLVVNSKELHKQPGANNLDSHEYKLHLLRVPPLLTAGSFGVRQRWCCTGDVLGPLSI